MSTRRRINIADDFSPFPSGRFRADGNFSGEAFRDDILAPALRSVDRVEVNLDGTMGFGSSFLEEAFGGLVTSCGFTSDDLASRLSFISSNDRPLISECREYINERKITTLAPLPLGELVHLAPGEAFIVTTTNGHGKVIDGPTKLTMAEVVLILGGTIIRTMEGCYWLIRHEDRRDRNVIPTFNGRSTFFRSAPANQRSPKDESPLSSRRAPWCIELRPSNANQIICYVVWMIDEAIGIRPTMSHDSVRDLMMIFPDGMSELQVAWMDSFIGSMNGPSFSVSMGVGRVRGT